jgi:rubredoxin
VFKKQKYGQSRSGEWKEVEYEVVCPQCKGITFETGSAFKAPKQSDVKAWGKLRSLFESGYKFNPDFGDPFKVVETTTKLKPEEVTKSIFQKSVRKRAKNT